MKLEKFRRAIASLRQIIHIHAAKPRRRVAPAPEQARAQVDFWCARCGAHADYRCRKHGDYLCWVCRNLHDLNSGEACGYDYIPVLAARVGSEA